MATTSESVVTVDSNESSESSSLLQSGNSGSIYTSVSEVSQRPSTPVESRIRLEWYYTLYATFLELWENIRVLSAGSWRVFSRRKFEAVLRCVCLPCHVLTRALTDGHRQYLTRPQPGIMYLYAYLCATVVLNLVVALHNINQSMEMAKYVQKCFVIFNMFFANILMLRLLLYTYATVTPSTRSSETFLRVFYKSGIYFFGFSSFGYSVSVVIHYISCRQGLDAVLTVTKATFTFLQILFLHYFYEARIPEDSPCIDIIMAHLLGTNLGLWFWTLCSDGASEMPKGPLKDYFSPLFVEYLLLAASLLYQIWKDSLPGDARMTLLERHYNILENNNNDRHSNTMNASNTASNTYIRPRPHNPSSGFGVIIGLFFTALFFVLVGFAIGLPKHTDREGYHVAYSIGVFILYLAQVIACYICQLSLQSHQHDPKNFSLDHEEILLYFSLVGIVLWEGFHAYSLILCPDFSVFDFGGDISAIVQHLFQTATIINLRRHKRTQGRCSVWICECVLFLLVTNLTFWVQDSFFIKVVITTPGERFVKMEHDLGTLGYILHPLSIFYRFHSSVCCVIAWDAFRNKQERFVPAS